MASPANPSTQSSSQTMTNELLQRLGDRLADFIESQQRTNKEITDKLNNLNRIADMVSENSKRIASLEQTVSALAHEVVELRETRLPSLIPKDHEMSDVELIVSGVPAVSQVTPDRLVRNVFEALDIGDLTCHILNVRSMVRKSTLDTGRDHSSRADEIVSLAVTLTSSTVRNEVMSKMRNRRVLKQSEICGNESNRRIYVNEMLPRATYDLLQSTKRIAKERSYKFVWTRRGCICVRHSEGKPIISIGSESDLTKLV
ncbi:uncharacterized protein [Temnothorax longispinosus]|uniref:uncharacterized protein n=1 Tax=Temnothorax longispinosus TaxID=300112 RepID=UPI003A999CD6